MVANAATKHMRQILQKKVRGSESTGVLALLVRGGKLWEPAVLTQLKGFMGLTRGLALPCMAWG